MAFSPSVFLVPIIAILTVIFTVLILRGPKKNEHYSKLDRAGIVTNVILALLYIPISLIGFFSVFAFDNPPAGAVASLTTLVNLGISLPIVSMLSIAFSIRFRRSGHSVLSFCVQFVPLTLFIIMEIGFMLI